jgi:DNA polymerase-4
VDETEIREQVAALSREVLAQAVAEERVVTHVGVVVRTSTFFTRTKTGKLALATTEPEPVIAKALEVLERFEISRPVRLLGVRLDLA